MRLTYPNFAAAIGAYVAAEAFATMNKPDLLQTRDGKPAHENNWHGVAFEDHLIGQLSDVTDLCSHGVTPLHRDEPCDLVIEPEPTDGVEEQRCACGYVRIERAAK